jgi:hypothetical protein
MKRREERRKMIRRGWEVTYEDGKTINEEQAEWKDIPKRGIRNLTLFYDGRQWILPNKGSYYQKKKASMVPGVPESFRIEERSIGYYEKDSLVLYTVNEFNGRMRMEVKELN